MATCRQGMAPLEMQDQTVTQNSIYFSLNFQFSYDNSKPPTAAVLQTNNKQEHLLMSLFPCLSSPCLQSTAHSENGSQGSAQSDIPEHCQAMSEIPEWQCISGLAQQTYRPQVVIGRPNGRGISNGTGGI